MLMKLEVRSKWVRRLHAYLWALLIAVTSYLPPASLDTFAQDNVNDVQAHPLTVATSFEGTIPPNGSAAYSITLKSGEYLRLQIVSTQADVTAIDPAGRTVAEHACDNRHTTPLSIVAKMDGRYLFVLRSSGQSTTAQQFTVRATEVRDSSPQDLNRSEAEQLFTEAVRLRRKWQTASSESAAKLFQRALDLWTSVGDVDSQALALLNLGRSYESLDQTPKAFECYEQALKLSEQSAVERRQLEALARLTSLCAISAQHKTAIEHGDRALKLPPEIQDKHIEAEIRNNIGDARYLRDETNLALEAYAESLRLWDLVDDLAGKAQVETSLGYAYLSRTEIENASKSFHNAVAFSQQANNRHLLALALRGLGSLYTKIGQPQRGLEAFREALALVEQGEGQLLRARVLGGIGNAYERIGDSEKALAYDNDAIRVFKQIGHRWGEAELQMDLGRVHYLRGENQLALDSYNLALSFFRELDMPRYPAQTLSNIGLVYKSWNDHTRALANYNSSLNLTRDNDKRTHAYTLNYLGELYRTQGRHAEALKNFEAAFLLQEDAKDQIGKAMTLYNRARSNRDLGHLSKAVDDSEAALKIIESIRASVAGETLRTSFGASVHQQYELRVDILMQQHKQQPSLRLDIAALEASERGRARSWLESFAEAEVDIRAGVDQSLLNRSESLRKRLKAKGQEGFRSTNKPRTRKEEVALFQEQLKLTRELNEIEEQIRVNSQRYRKLPGASVLSSEKIQKLVDNDSLLLEFSLGEDRSYVWVVSSKSIESFTLPGRKVIEDACKDLYEALIALAQERGKPITMNGARVVDREANINRFSNHLASLILDPVQSLLGQKRLLIISDGALQYIPFEVLSRPATSTAASGQLLIEGHEIVYLPSASVIARHQTRLANRAPASMTLAMFADPVFNNTDERISERRPSRTSSQLDQGRGLTKQHNAPGARPSNESISASALRAAGFDNGIPRLPYSYLEAQRIQSLVAREKRLIALGFDANRQEATSRELTSYRLLHFATHGILNSEAPELSGILLSMVDHKGKAQDGFLQLHEIYNLHLPVEVVVLSACQTALGKEIKGEGLFGLTRGFMHAGARQVVSSLWKVDDSATAELMELFYKEMLTNKRSPAAALQIAKLDLRKRKRWQNPFYWAGFIIQGDWRPTLVE